MDRTHPLSEVVADFRRERLYERVLLRGPPEDIQAMLVREMRPGRVVIGATR